jgi:lantibiotic modifying enzyme
MEPKMSTMNRRAFVAGGAAVLLSPQPSVGAEASSESSAEWLAALAAERWLRKSRRVTDHGVRWPVVPGSDDSSPLDLYVGNAGVLLFYAELAAVTRAPEYVDELLAGGHELAHRLPEARRQRNLPSSLLVGLPGIGFALEQVHRVTGQEWARQEAAATFDWLLRHAHTRGTGVQWTSPFHDVLLGLAGTGFGLLWASDALALVDGVEFAAAAGRRLISLASAAGDGCLRWEGHVNADRIMPNYSHGTAGIAHFLARLHRATGERVFLDAALAGARYLESIARCDERGWLVRHHDGDEELFYLGWCHGPAGTGRLFAELGQITGDPHWDDQVRRLAAGVIATGAPETRSPGFWNNVSQCCGDCGLGEWFLELDRANPEPSWAGMVDRIAKEVIRRGDAVGDGLRWVQAEHRIQPELLEAQTGYMQGAAGIGSFLLHVQGHRVGRAPFLVRPDLS